MSAHLMILSAFQRLLSDPELDPPCMDPSQPMSAIIDIEEIDSSLIRHKYGAEHVYETMLNDLSVHRVAYRGDSDDSTCLTHPKGLCPATARVILWTIAQRRMS